MKHILKIGKRYHYNRRVPSELIDFDPREYVRVSLKTDSYKEACQKAGVYDQKIEAYWNDLLKTGKKYTSQTFQSVVRKARLLGFEYKSVEELTKTDLHEVIKRYETLAGNEKSKPLVTALLGGAQEKSLALSEVPNSFWAISEDRIINKSEDQVRKWKNPRKRAFKNLIDLIGDKEVKRLTRDDMIAFRDWWIKRIQKGSLSKNSANKEIHAIKNMIERINEHERLGLDASWLFSKIGLLDRGNKAKRSSFDSSYIIKNFLQKDSMLGLNDEAKAIVRVLAETGARPKEICGLEGSDIVLDHEVPHIKIRFKDNQELKTIYSERDIPLVGLALDTIKSYPDGFSKYRGRSDTLSATVNKYFRENNLVPSKKHSLYSLRHSFQDRMTEANIPDRVQCELFGHKFSRPEYGAGPSLKLKLEWLQKIQLSKKECWSGRGREFKSPR